MGTSMDLAFIEGLQYRLKTTCETLEEHGHESIVITVNQESQCVTGSEKGKAFLENKVLFISEFIQFCKGTNLPVEFKLETDTVIDNEVKTARKTSEKSAINVDAPDKDLVDMPTSSVNVVENMFNGDTDDFDETSNLDVAILGHVDTDIDTKKEDNLEHLKGSGILVNKSFAVKRGKTDKVVLSRSSNRKQKPSDKLKNKQTKFPECKVILTKLETCKISKYERENNVTDLICNICKAQLLTQELLDSHMVLFHNSSKCVICKKEFETEASLNEHKQTHVDNNEFHECKQCEKVFRLSWQLDEHIEKVHVKVIELEKGQFPCCHCGYAFKFESHLSEHNQLMPNCKSEIPAQVKKSKLVSGEISYKDPISGEMKTRKWKQLLDKKGSSAVCEICLKSFDQIGNYRRHVLIHSDLMAFKCYICSKDFKFEENLKKHLKQHDARPYHCGHCHWRFNTKSRRDFHVRFTCTKHKDKPDLVCSECGHQLATQHALKAHQATHTGIKPWKCDLCSHWSSSKQALVAHKKVTHGINKWKYKCEHCDDKFIVRGMWVRHMKLHGELSIKCEVCDKGFLDEASKEKHMKVHGEKKKFACELCPRRFERPARLSEHMRQHTGERPFICEICAMAFNRNARLIEHRRVHTGEKPYKCDFQECDKRFTSLGSLKQHKRSHIPNRCFVCDYCGRTFKTERALCYHRKNHTVDWRWPCVYCEEKYKSISVYKKHLSKCHPEMKDNIEQRTNIRLHRCHICFKTYSKSLDLKRHLFIHQGLKPFKCQFCDKCFNDKSNMKCHERLHTGEKRFQCNLCCKKFIHPRGLRVHQYNVHCSKVNKDNILGTAETVIENEKYTTTSL